MVDAITGLDEKLTDIRVRLGRLEERSVHTEGRADRTNTEMGEVKAMTTEKRKASTGSWPP